MERENRIIGHLGWFTWTVDWKFFFFGIYCLNSFYFSLLDRIEGKFEQKKVFFCRGLEGDKRKIKSLWWKTFLLLHILAKTDLKNILIGSDRWMKRQENCIKFFLARIWSQMPQIPENLINHCRLELARPASNRKLWIGHFKINRSISTIQHFHPRHFKCHK